MLPLRPLLRLRLLLLLLLRRRRAGLLLRLRLLLPLAFLSLFLASLLLLRLRLLLLLRCLVRSLLRLRRDLPSPRSSFLSFSSSPLLGLFSRCFSFLGVLSLSEPSSLLLSAVGAASADFASSPGSEPPACCADGSLKCFEPSCALFTSALPDAAGDCCSLPLAAGLPESVVMLSKPACALLPRYHLVVSDLPECFGCQPRECMIRLYNDAFRLRGV